ncbi:bactofilin family protein [Pajaroellobacter abortibovis]|uniref:Cell shape determination protein CcmA n=1 Tax=Pajaroellobacter abortibovis TaxID=1882918 RepID=A0A1L6MZ36_9BACT|nr:polymer-forming cytoskeletal protein [Pajaroellobacter abortibovis]APS00698.1 hypothetical protein BCY86_08420 [Pajaroellobacter abortibovis]
MAHTVIGAELTIEGEVSSEDAVVIRGMLRGKLTSKEAISVEQGGKVEADVEGASLTVCGVLTGNVKVEDRVDLKTGSKVVGNVKASRFTIADGAQFKGSVDMDVEG